MTRRNKPGPGRSLGPIIQGEVTDAGDREAVVTTPKGPIRVRGAVLGDRVRVAVTHRGRNATWGRVVELVTPSRERVEPRCSVIERCGGCPWQAWDVEAQRAEKRRRLTAILRNVDTPRVAPVAAAPDTYAYRNKLLVAVGGRSGALKFGLYATRSHEVVAIRSCAVHELRGEAALAGVREILNAARIPPVNTKTGRGVLRHVLLRVAPGTGEIGVTLVVRAWPLRGASTLARRILALPDIVSVYLNHNPTVGSVALGPRSELVAGKPRLAAEVEGVRFLLSPTAFFQTNTPALPILLGAVRDALPERIGSLVDLYAGVGLFSLTLASRARHVLAVESNPEAVGDLRAAAKRAGLTHVQALVEDAERVFLPPPRPEALIVDPPRAGLPPRLLQRVVHSWRPKRLVYVSCGPKALARDLAALIAGGYAVDSVQPVDLFPHTPHIETVVGLRSAVTRAAQD